jgi:F-type H+-transporting ATPase subunit gamma
LPTIREVRRRIKSVQNTAKITKAMEMVAASKMRRAQDRCIAARPYTDKMMQVLASLAAEGQEGEETQPLLVHRPVNRIELVHLTPDRGLCGGLNASVNRTAAGFILEQSVPVSVISLGRKGRDFMMRTGQDVRAGFVRMSDQPTVADIRPVVRIVMEDYASGFADQVYLCYSRFVTTMTQEPVVWQLLPIEPTTEPGRNIEFIYEPSPHEVLGQLLPRFVEMQLYHVLLEARASEHSARMVAMRNATVNANDLVDDLTLTHNKLRQQIITEELMDITGGAAALRQ